MTGHTAVSRGGAQRASQPQTGLPSAPRPGPTSTSDRPPHRPGRPARVENPARRSDSHQRHRRLGWSAGFRVATLGTAVVDHDPRIVAEAAVDLGAAVAHRRCRARSNTAPDVIVNDRHRAAPCVGGSASWTPQSTPDRRWTSEDSPSLPSAHGFGQLRERAASRADTARRRPDPGRLVHRVRAWALFDGATNRCTTSKVHRRGS